jgi:acetyl esterase/lipase
MKPLPALILAAALAASPALAQDKPPAGFEGFMAVMMEQLKAAPAPDIAPIPLGAMGSPADAQWETMEGYLTARNVTQPALYPVLPAPGTANGTAVIIAPGGAFLTLAFDTEGREVAKYLAARGITCFVLTYRVDPTPRDVPGLARTIGERMSKAPPKMTHGEIEAPAETLAAADGLSAMTWVRSHAGDYGIDPHKIGFMGFSAGGMTTTNVATTYTAESRPDFVGVIYGAMHPRAVPADAPPAFIALAADDPLLGYASVPIFDAWREAGKPAELHIYARGSHGFGMRKTGTSSEHWIEDYYNWLVSEHLTTAK